MWNALKGITTSTVYNHPTERVWSGCNTKCQGTTCSKSSKMWPTHHIKYPHSSIGEDDGCQLDKNKVAITWGNKLWYQPPDQEFIQNSAYITSTQNWNVSVSTSTVTIMSTLPKQCCFPKRKHISYFFKWMYKSMDFTLEFTLQYFACSLWTKKVIFSMHFMSAFQGRF